MASRPAWAAGRFPGLLIGFIGAVLRAPAMAGHFPADRRGTAVQALGDSANQRATSDSAGDVFSFCQGE